MALMSRPDPGAFLQTYRTKYGAPTRNTSQGAVFTIPGRGRIELAHVPPDAVLIQWLEADPPNAGHGKAILEERRRWPTRTP